MIVVKQFCCSIAGGLLFDHDKKAPLSKRGERVMVVEQQGRLETRSSTYLVLCSSGEESSLESKLSWVSRWLAM